MKKRFFLSMGLFLIVSFVNMAKAQYYDPYSMYMYTLEMGGKSIVTFAVPLASVSYEMYFSTYKNIRAKIDRGEDLSESEKELFESILDYLQECLSDIEIRVYVKHNGETYDLYEDSFAVGVELDSSY